MRISFKRKLTRALVVLFLGLTCTLTASAQVSISGPTCVSAGVLYSYQVSGPNFLSSDYTSWCAAGGNISGGSAGSSYSCKNGTYNYWISVTWSSTAQYLYVNTPSGSTYLYPTISSTLNAGSITSNSSQTINYNTTPATINCSAATGGGCSPSHSYQWQQSGDGANWTDISGKTSQNLIFTSTLIQTTYYRRKVTETSTGSVGYSGTATVFVNPPSIVPGVSTPAYQLTNSYTTAPLTLVTKPATLVTCPDGTCFTYQWQKSTNGTSWSDITGATSLTNNPGNFQPTVLTYYRTKVTANGQTAYSNIDTIATQSSVITGPVDCWVGQTVLYYLTGSNPSFMTWYVPPGGQAIGSTTGVGSITVKWNIASTYTINLDNNGTFIPISVYVHVLPLNPGFIGKPVQSIENTASVTIDPWPFYGATGGNCTGNFTYQWQQSTDSINYTNIAGQTGTSLTITPTQNVYYRRQVSCSGIFYSDTTRIILYTYFNPGTVSAGNTDSIGWNTIPLPIAGSYPTGGVDSIYRYQWEYSTNGSNYFEITNNAQGQNYQPDSLSVSTYFRRRVTNGVTTRYTNAALVKVKILHFDPGTISPYTVVINSGGSSSLTGTAATGGTVASYSYQWEQSSDETNWKNVTGGTTQNYSPGALTKTTYYRRRVTNSAQTAYSFAAGSFNLIKVKVLPGSGGTNIPTTVTQATADPTITAVAIKTYTLPSITNSKINYVRSWDVEKPLVTTLAAAKALSNQNDYNQVTAYFDDLGRPVQTVAKQATPAQKDIVSSVVNYDILGRAVQEYLPYTDGTITGDFKTNPSVQQPTFYNSFYNNTEGFYYAATNYEKSPLNRVLKETAPGKSFTGSNVGIRTDYNFNALTDSVKIWTIGTNAGDVPTVTGAYAAGSLVLIVATDEHENKVMEYKDKEDKTILKKVQISDTIYNGYRGWLSTHYVYDVFGKLRYVLSPKAVEYAAANSWALNQTVRDELCFRYWYDAADRMAIIKVPGAGEAYMVYDARDRLVMTQDSTLKTQGKWMYTQYDSLNRPVLTGLWTTSGDRSFHQNLAGASVAYPNPGSGFEVLTQTYYDDYTWVSSSGSGLSSSFITTNTTNTTYFYTPSNTTYPYPQTIAGDLQNKGMGTGSKTKVVGTPSTYLYTVSFYDDRGRMVQAHATNYSGGKDTITNQYDFNGRLIRSLFAHGKSGTNPQSYKILTKNEYDPAGRLLKISKKTGNSPEVVIADNVYDEIGQLAKKSIGRQRNTVNTNTYTTNPIDSLRFTYNIRGWLRGINKDYARNENSAVNWFGMELDYDFGFNATQFNGNIAGMRWRSKGDGEQRAYGFGYDNTNRLLKGDFTQYNGAWNTSLGIDYTMKMGNGVSPYSAYDANGNILSMTQKGLKLATSPVIDTLKYGYNATSNKLNYVTDVANDVNSKMGDFKEINNNTTQDYTYDGNGNLTIDNNKRITSITYNHLNLPAQIKILGKGVINYTYDAGGNKLQKQTIDSTIVPVKTTITSYIGNFIYQNDTLQFIAHEEGRVRPKRTNYTDTMYYDYFEKDHLGNVRTVLTDQLQQDIYPAATLEGTYSDGNTAVGYEKNFYTINSANIVDNSQASGITAYPNNNGIANPYPTGNSGNTNVNNNSQKLYKLQATATTNGGVNGLGMTLKVMSGDKIDIMGKSYYAVNNTGGLNYNVPILDIITGLIGSTGGTAASKGFTPTDLNGQSSITTPINSFLSDAGRGSGTTPKAYINWILFDENFKYVNGNFSRAGTAGSVKSHYGDAQLQNIPVSKNGYLYVYVSNESPVAVFFDNLQVIHTRGPLLEETHYYPFGLTMSGISAKALNFGNPGNKKKYNGIELDNDLDLNVYEAFYRNLDPQIGRWWQIDPEIDNMQQWSPYALNYDSPIFYSDPQGDWPKWLDKAVDYVGDKAKQAGNWVADHADEILDVAGAIDPTGIVDGIHAVSYLVRGDLKNAAISGLSILPGGDAAKAAKYTEKAAVAVEKAIVKQEKKIVSKTEQLAINKVAGKAGEQKVKGQLTKELKKGEKLLEQPSFKLNSGNRAKPDFAVVGKDGKIVKTVDSKTGKAGPSKNQKELQKSGGTLTGKKYKEHNGAKAKPNTFETRNGD